MSNLGEYFLLHSSSSPGDKNLIEVSGTVSNSFVEPNLLDFLIWISASFLLHLLYGYVL